MFQGNRDEEPIWRVHNVLKRFAWGDDLDELIECQSIHSRDLGYLFEHDLNFAHFAPRCARPFAYAIHKRMRYTSKHFADVRIM